MQLLRKLHNDSRYDEVVATAILPRLSEIDMHLLR